MLRVQRVARLIDVAQLHRLAEPDAARVGLLLAGDHPEQRRLAGAVGADDADDAARRQLEVQVLDQQAVAEALAQTLRLDDQRAQPRAGWNDDLRTARRPVRGLCPKRLERLDARLRLCLARARAGADPVQLARQRLLPRRLLLLLQRQTLLFLLQPR